jgi:hypothetical protein
LTLARSTILGTVLDPRAKKFGSGAHAYCTGLFLPRLLAAEIALPRVIFLSKRMISNVPSLS